MCLRFCRSLPAGRASTSETGSCSPGEWVPHPTVRVPHPAAAYQMRYRSAQQIRDVWLLAMTSFFAVPPPFLCSVLSQFSAGCLGVPQAVYLENWIHELNHTIYPLILPVEFFPVNLGKFTIDFSEKRTMI